MSEEINNEIDTSFLEDVTEFQSWVLNVEASIVYKGKSLKDWAISLEVPSTVSSNLSLEEVEKFNNKLIILTETIMSNLAIAKAAYFSAKAGHALEMLKQRNRITDNVSSSGRKLPSAENLEKQCLSRCVSTWKLELMNEVVYEFWNTQSYKLSHLHSRATSLNILKNINSKI